MSPTRDESAKKKRKKERRARGHADFRSWTRRGCQTTVAIEFDSGSSWCALRVSGRAPAATRPDTATSKPRRANRAIQDPTFSHPSFSSKPQQTTWRRMTCSQLCKRSSMRPSWPGPRNRSTSWCVGTPATRSSAASPARGKTRSLATRGLRRTLRPLGGSCANANARFRLAARGFSALHPPTASVTPEQFAPATCPASPARSGLRRHDDASVTQAIRAACPLPGSMRSRSGTRPRAAAAATRDGRRMRARGGGSGTLGREERLVTKLGDRRQRALGA